MACPPGNCAAWGAFRLCKPLPPIVIDGSYSPDELQLLWFCWRARSTGEYGGSTPVDLGFNTPGLIDISKTTNIAKIIAYCDSRGTLVRQFTNFSRFGVKFNLPNFKASGSFSTWSGGVFGSTTSPGGGGGGGGGEDPVGPDPTGGGTSGGGGGTCPCTSDNGSDLTVVVCAEINCEDAEPNIQITVCGGTPPYSWSTSGGEGDPTEVQSGTNNKNVKVTAPNRPAVSGTAYSLGLETTRFADCPNPAFQHSNNVGCDDVEISACTGPTGLAATFQVVCSEAGEAGCPGFADCAPGACTFSLCCPFDRRTQQMKDDGCLPCALSMDGLTITVEDDVGDTVATVISL